MSFSRYKTLLKSRGFESFLWTQFLGAFNDNVFKMVLSLVAVNMAAGGGAAKVSLVGAVFILPFVLFSGYAGHFADARNKRSVFIVSKSMEIVATALGLIAFVSGSFHLMLATLFLMASQSTFFSPAKYGIIPEMLPPEELSRANGLLEMTTFLAIILGTAAGSFIYSAWKESLYIAGAFLVVIAIIGTAASFGTPRVPSPAPGKAFSLNPWKEVRLGLGSIRNVRVLGFSVALIAYFWFLGALLQMDILLMGKEVLGATDVAVGLLITALAVGIGLGSIMAGRLSGDKIEPGLVPIGSLLMGLFSITLYLSSGSYLLTAVSLMLLGFSGGLFIVPLNAILQKRSAPAEKGRVIATNNFLNTLGILVASGILWVMRDGLGISADEIVLIFGIVTLVMTLYVAVELPEFLLRFFLWLLTHTVYRIRIIGAGNIPQRGPALLISNHVTFVDALLIGSCVHRFVRFMVYERFYAMKPIGWVMRLLKAVPVSEGTKKDVLRAIGRARKELEEGHVVCIFSEGMLTRTGNMLPFKKGFEKIIEGLDVPVVPVHLDNVWTSVFSFKGGRFFKKLPREVFSPVTVSFGGPMKGAVQAEDVRQAVAELGVKAMENRIGRNDSLHYRFIRTAKRSWRRPCMADSTGKDLTYGRALTGALMLSSMFRRTLGPGECTALLLPASVGGALSNIALLMAGKVPVNLNFTSGIEALDTAIRKCGARSIVTSRAFLDKAGLTGLAEGLKGEGADIVCLEDFLKEAGRITKISAALKAYLLPARLLSSRSRGPASERLATVVFTSGSTGVPKGVMLTHRNVLSNIEGFSQVFSLTDKDVLLGVLPFFHSFGFTATIWFPMLSGIRAVFHPNPLDAKTVGDLARAYGATILIGTPTFYSAYLKRCSREDFSKVRYAIAGAEKLKQGLSREFREKFGIELLEGYGCTEMAPVVAVNVPDVEDGDIRQKGFKAGTVGATIPGVAAKVVDPATHEALPAGSEGLLLVKGPNLMAGYLGEPERTAEVIRNGWYVTGDIASIGDDGFIRITDRLSRFSKIGGEMVPHVKIEETINGILGSGESAVVTVPDESRGERVVVFYSGSEVSPGEVWSRLRETGLPRLWMPGKEDIHLLAEIPKTATGKADLMRMKAMAVELAGVSIGGRAGG